jgi:hypothetical protein
MGLNPDLFYLITSGTSLGGDSLIYSLLDSNPSLRVLAFTSSEVHPGSLDPRSHGLSILGDTWKSRNDEVRKFIKQTGGSILFLDAGLKGKDLFQDVWNDPSVNYFFYSRANEHSPMKNIFHSALQGVSRV